MGKLDDIRKAALAKALAINSKPINESRIVYEDGHPEKMNSILAKQLRDRNHSLGTHPIFPDSDESHFEEKIMSKRFADVLKNYKRQFDTETADPREAITNMMPIVQDCLKIESKHREKLQELAIAMIRKEYDMGEDDVEIIAELTPHIDISGIQKNRDRI